MEGCLPPGSAWPSVVVAYDAHCLPLSWVRVVLPRVLGGGVFMLCSLCPGALPIPCLSLCVLPLCTVHGGVGVVPASMPSALGLSVVDVFIMPQCRWSFPMSLPSTAFIAWPRLWWSRWCRGPGAAMVPRWCHAPGPSPCPGVPSAPVSTLNVRPYRTRSALPFVFFNDMCHIISLAYGLTVLSSPNLGRGIVNDGVKVLVLVDAVVFHPSVKL